MAGRIKWISEPKTIEEAIETLNPDTKEWVLIREKRGAYRKIKEEIEAKTKAIEILNKKLNLSRINANRISCLYAHDQRETIAVVLTQEEQEILDKAGVKR